MQQLRESDVNGAPILFLAASGRGSQSCFKAVRHEIEATLSVAGRSEQVEAIDEKGRGIVMYAARSHHLDVFQEARRMLRKLCQHSFDEEEWRREWRQREIKPDETGMNLLHHASEAGCPEIIKEVSGPENVRW